MRKQKLAGRRTGDLRDPGVRPRRIGLYAVDHRLRGGHRRAQPLDQAKLDGLHLRRGERRRGRRPTLGVNVSTYKLTAFGIGTALAGLAGGLYVYFAQFITVDTFDFIVSVMLLTMVVIGGIGSTWGVTAAATVRSRCCRRRSGFATTIGC